MCIIELVDFNTIYTKETSIQTAKKTRRGKKSSSGTVTGTSTDNVVAAPVAQTNKDVDNSENSSEVSLEEKAE